MSIFGAILDKLRRHSSPSASASTDSGLSGSPQQQPASAGPITGQTQTAGAAPGQAQSAGSPSATPAATPQRTEPLSNVDVDAVLADLAARKGGGGNYRQSIVDLLKLLDLDSSLAARKELAQELDVSAGAHGSAEQNIALHRAVMQKLAENGGKVPESLRQ